MRKPYGHFGRPLALLENYGEWRDDRLEKIDLGLMEADSKADFPEFLYGPISVSMWGGYNRVAAQYRKYARIESTPDFRERRLRGLTGVRGIGRVGDHGEYPAMRRGERPPAGLMIDTYGGVYQITRQAIINDETGELLNSVPRDMGRDSARFVSRTIVALIESNPTAPDGDPMFEAAPGRGNQVVTALSEGSLAAAISFGEGQLDDDGDPIIVTYKNLVVKSAEMELIARRILTSQYAGTTVNDPVTTAFDKGTANPLAGILPLDGIVREPWFSDPNDWYLFADPGDVPGFAIGFLNGNETPFIGLKNPEVRNALGPGVDPYTYEFDTIDFKVRIDFGTAAVDPRGVFRGVVV